MKRLLSILTILLVILLASCLTSTTYKIEPSEPESTLVIGQINLKLSGFPSEYQANGPHGRGLVLRFNDEDGNKTTVTAYGKKALFAFEASKDYYELNTIEFSNDRSWAKISMNWGCNITPGQVNNLGMIQGEWEAAFNDVTLYPSGGYDELKNYFIERYPESGWNDAVWTNVSFQAGR